MTGLLVTLALIEGLLLGSIIYYWGLKRRRRREAAALLERLLGELKTAAICPRGWPEENDPTLVSTSFAPAEERLCACQGECEHGKLVGPADMEAWADRAAHGCPATGVFGIHSDEYLEGEGNCQWCGARPQTDD